MRVYQRYSLDDPGGTDSYYRTRREAMAAGRFLINPSPIYEHDVNTSKGGIIDALQTIPMRSEQPLENYRTQEPDDQEPELDFEPEEEPEIAL